jgi:hypothetical protein
MEDSAQIGVALPRVRASESPCYLVKKADGSEWLRGYNEGGYNFVEISLDDIKKWINQTNKGGE